MGTSKVGERARETGQKREREEEERRRREKKVNREKGEFHVLPGPFFHFLSVLSSPFLSLRVRERERKKKKKKKKIRI